MKPKTIRLEILEALNKHGEQTLDNMLDRLPEYDRPKLQSNINQAKIAGLIDVRLDDVTRLPAYRISNGGLHMLKNKSAKPEAATPAPVHPIDTSAKRGDEPPENRHVEIDDLPPEAQRELVMILTEIRVVLSGGGELVPLKDMPKMIFRIKEDGSTDKREIERMRGELLKANERHTRDSAEITRVGSLYNSEILQKERFSKEFARVAAENTALKQLNKDMPGFGAVHEALKASQYLILAPKRKPQRIKSQEKAQDIALKAASVRGMAEVYALVPVGKAVRGAVWKDNDQAKGPRSGPA